MTSIIRCVVFALMFIAMLSYAQEKTIDVSEHIVYKGPVSTADNFCETILYNPTLGISTIKMHDFISDDPDVVVNVNGVKITDLVDDIKPGEATAGKHIRVPNGDPRVIQPNVGFSVVLLSKQLTTALEANKTVAITIRPGPDMFDKSPKTINFPAEPNCTK
jgi:hypothetical protein